MTLIWETLKFEDGTSPSFDNPHGWTVEQVDELYELLSEKINAAWSIKLMGVSHHLKAGNYETQIEKLKGV